MEIFDRPLSSENAAWTSNIVFPKAPNETVNLRRLLVKLWARKWLILTPIIICGGLAFVTTRLITPVYIGVAQVVIKPQQAGAPATNASVMAAIRGGPEAVPTEAIVLQSRLLAKSTIERLHLDQDPEFAPLLRKPNALLARFDPMLEFVDTLGSRFQTATGFLADTTDSSTAREETTAETQSAPLAGATTPSMAVLNSFMARLRVSVQQHTDVIEVSFRSSRAVTAASVPNTLVQLYLDRQVSEKDKVNTGESKRLDKVILPVLREKMQASELALAEYRQKSGLVSDQNPTVLNQQLSDMNSQLAVARAQKASVNARLNQIRGLVSSSNQRASTSEVASPAAASESPILARLREQEVEVQRQLAELTGSHDTNYPRVQQLTAQLAEVKGAIRRESAGVVGRLQAELAAAEAMEAALRRRTAEIGHEFADANGGDTRLQALLREADADRKTYERYLALANEARNTFWQAQPDASFVSPADVPVRPSFPNTRWMVMLGVATGAGIGMVLAALIDTLRHGVLDKKQVEEVLGIKCLGLVPRIRHSRRRHRGPLLSTQDTAFEQAIRSVRLKLFSFDDRHDSRVVLVTAALPNEGKTWIAASLAGSLADDGLSVVLIDCDQHRPTVHRMLGGRSAPGLTDYFSGAAELNEILYCDRRSGVNYIPVGAASPRMAWRITADRLLPLIGRLSEKYKHIILDSAPLLAVSETMLLSQMAQKTILVVKWDSTPLEIARDAVAELLGSGAETAVALSMVDMKRAAKYGDPQAAVYKRLESYYSHRGRLE